MKSVKALDIDRLGRVLTLLRVEPVLGLLEHSENLLLLLGLDVRSVTLVKSTPGVVSELLKGVLPLL